MIAGAGVGIAGGGASMLRTRRRDINIKPNRKLDRKSSRGMLYENEELRLRTININAEVEQGQNDIKKLRRENEQLRREIWSLRDEYDKLEEILKKQRNREKSENSKDCSEDETNGSEYWDDDDEQDNEETTNHEVISSDDDTNKDHNHEERLENAENQKISTEKMNNNVLIQHRSRINFDDLSVVEEEEELKKDKEKKEDSPIMQSFRTDSVQQDLTVSTNQFPYRVTAFDKTNPLSETNLGYQSDSTFTFLNVGSSNSYSNTLPIDRSCLLMTTCSQINSSNSSQQPIIPLTSLATPSLNMNLNVDIRKYPTPLQKVTSPPPIRWQNSMSMLATRGSPVIVSKMQPLTFDSLTYPTKDLPFQSPGHTGLENEQLISTPNSKLTTAQSLVEKRKAFFKLSTDTLKSYEFRNTHINGLAALDKNVGNSIYEKNKKFERSTSVKTRNRETVIPDISLVNKNTPRHFFAPLSINSKFPYVEEKSSTKLINDSKIIHNSDNGNILNSKKTASTVISRNQHNSKKGSADICVNGAIPFNGSNQIEKGDAKAFFSSENLFVLDDMLNNRSSNGSNNLLPKSISCQDLSTRLSYTENLKNSNNNHNHTKSDNTLGNITLSSKPFRSQLNVTLRRCKSSSSDISRLPSIDYKLFNNPFLQNFEQACQNFPARTEGQSPVTHPVSIQVSKSPVFGTKYSSSVMVQPSFTNPNMLEPDCDNYKRKNLGRLKLMIPSAKWLDQNTERQEYHITSFETPSPRTVQIPPITPYEIENLRRLPTRTSPIQRNSKLHQDVPFVPRGATCYCSGQGMRMYYDTLSMKVPAQTQTSIEDEVVVATPTDSDPKIATINIETCQPKINLSTKLHSYKDKSNSIKDKQKSQDSQKYKDQLVKQSSINSKDASEFPIKIYLKTHSNEINYNKNENRSSASGQESPKKEQIKRVSLYCNTKKRPSLNSIRTSRSRSVENTKENYFIRDEITEVNKTISDKERTNSISSREAVIREKIRKASTSSGSVPWCACWGNGCI